MESDLTDYVTFCKCLLHAILEHSNMVSAQPFQDSPMRFFHTPASAVSPNDCTD